MNDGGASNNVLVDLEDLRELLFQVHMRQDEELRATFDRSLPFADGMFDRWERARRLGFGADASIYDSSIVLGNVMVGDHTWVGPFTVLDGSGGGLSIGRYCSISAGVHVYTHDTVLWALSGGEVDRREGAVSIGERCYIGSQSIVTAGVAIGEGSVVTSNSFVNQNVAPATIVGGTPARVIGHVAGSGADVRLEFPG